MNTPFRPGQDSAVVRGKLITRKPLEELSDEERTTRLKQAADKVSQLNQQSAIKRQRELRNIRRARQT